MVKEPLYSSPQLSKTSPKKGELYESLYLIKNELEKQSSNGQKNQSEGLGIESPSSGSKGNNSSSSPVITPVYPLALALLPAVISLLVGDSAGVFIMDALLLAAIGWIIFSITEGSWRIYYCKMKQNSGTNNDDQHVSSLQNVNLLASSIVYLGTPFLGGWVLYFSRENLSGGSKLISNFNIFLYISLDLGRCINRMINLGNYQVVDVTAANGDDITERLKTMEDNIAKIHAEIVMAMDKIQTNETAFNNELYTTWKGIEKVHKGLKSISSKTTNETPHDTNNSSYKLRRGKTPKLHQQNKYQLDTVDELQETAPQINAPPTISKLKYGMVDDDKNSMLFNSKNSPYNKKKGKHTENYSQGEDIKKSQSVLRRVFFTTPLNVTIYIIFLLPYRILVRFTTRRSKADSGMEIGR